MILSFHDQGTEDIFNRKNSKAARKLCPVTLWRVAQRKLDQLNAVVSLASLAIRRVTGWKRWGGNDEGNTASESTSSTESASDGRTKGQRASRSRIIIESTFSRKNGGR